MTVIPFPIQQAFQKKERPFLGHSIKNGKIRYSSVTQITMFDPMEEGGCNRKYAYQYLFGKKPAKGEALLVGADLAEKLEHFLKTNEDILPPILQPAKKFFPVPGPDLEVEQPLGDMVEAVHLRDEQIKHACVEYIEKIQRAAGLTAAGIPLDGAADYRHRRGEYIDEDGVLQREQSGLVIAEVGDLKSTKRINSRWTKGQTTFLQGYAKTSAQVCEQTQMLGYGWQEIYRHPETTHVRLSHVYAQKESSGAAKRTGLVSADTIRERWHRIDGVMNKMQQVATAERIEDVEPNPSACDAYTHVGLDGKTQKGCAHRLYCPLSDSQFVPGMLSANKEISGMSLFDTPSSPPTNGVSPPAPLSAPISDAAHAAAVARERERLLAEDALIRVKNKIAAGTLRLDPSGQVHDKEGAEAGGWILRWPTDVEKAALMMGVPGAPPAPPMQNPVLPKDAPQVGVLDGAAPLPSAAITEISDPVLRATVEAHAAIHADRAAVEAIEDVVGEGGVWCAGGKQRITLTMEMALARKMNCEQCGKPITLKPAKEGDVYVATIPRHKPVKVEGAISVSIPGSVPPVPTVLPPAPPRPPLPPPMVAAAVQIDNAIAKASEVSLYVDVLVERGEPLRAFEEYYQPLVDFIAMKAGVSDLRFTAKESPLAYGGWKGALSAKCKENPPSPGSYFVRGSDEIAQVALIAVAPMCSAVYRGR